MNDPFYGPLAQEQAGAAAPVAGLFRLTDPPELEKFESQPIQFPVEELM